MANLLLPCDGSPNALRAVRHVIAEHRREPGLRVHLLNVQPAFSAYVARHVSREVRADFHRERSSVALEPARRLLAEAGVEHHVHAEVGDRVGCILAAARRLRCDRIVMGTARRSPLVRAIGQSLTGALIERADVPVEVIVGDQASALERIGIPASVGAGAALLWAAN
ncbi:universal stress protein [Azohydromonas aeria]|uniref:universal stress protein n=1 Tax=Azohydromonas aeria TaxID=2590212 RepID=UPI0012F89120|nr:universal stress protein [Azohydromonas aeria]